MRPQRGSRGLRFVSWFCGAGGDTQGAAAVPGGVPVFAANHDKLAIETHSTSFPQVEHFRGDIQDLDVATHPYAEFFWASPECTPPVSEVLLAALVECIQGHDLDWSAAA